MTLICELDLDILKLYLHTESDISNCRLSKIRAQTGHTQKDKPDQMQYHAAFTGGNN